MKSGLDHPRELLLKAEHDVRIAEIGRPPPEAHQVIPNIPKSIRQKDGEIDLPEPPVFERLSPLDKAKLMSLFRIAGDRAWRIYRR